MKRIAIIGSPRAGKTTLATRMGAVLHLPVVSSDDLIHMGWSEASEELAQRMLDGEPCIYEGVAVVRALRKACAKLHRDARPVDRCFVLDEPLEPLNRGQRSMRRGGATILAALRPELERRHVHLTVLGPDDVSAALLACVPRSHVEDDA